MATAVYEPTLVGASNGTKIASKGDFAALYVDDIWMEMYCAIPSELNCELALSRLYVHEQEVHVDEKFPTTQREAAVRFRPSKASHTGTCWTEGQVTLKKPFCFAGQTTE